MASATYNSQGVSAKTLVQGVNSHGGNINVSVHEGAGGRLDLLDWLSPVSIEKHHDDLKSNLIVAEHSGSWFLNSRPYLDWIQSTQSGRVLWCPGLPGAGKTVMASLVIDRLLTETAAFGQRHNDSVCWLYLGHDDARIRPGALLGALLRYLIRKSECIPHSVEKLHQTHLEAKTFLRDDSTMSCLIEVCQGKKNVFLVVDAMDEYSEAQRSHLIQCLHNMLQKLPALKILVTSRFIQSIQDELDSPKRYDIEAHDDDLDAFVRTQLGMDKNKHLRRFAMTAHGTETPIMSKIIDAVIRRSDKIFLLAKLQLDHVASKRTQTECLAALDEPPMNRDELYAKTVDRIMAQSDENRAWAIRILTWVFYAERALTADELQVAIQRECFSGSTLDDSSKLSNEDIVEFCGGLISINKHTNSAVPFHYTIKEYFGQNQDKHFPEAHNMITFTCASRLKAMSREVFSRTVRENNQIVRELQGCGLPGTLVDHALDNIFEDHELENALDNYQLTRYSIEYLDHHAVRAERYPHTVFDTHQLLYDMVGKSDTRELLVRLLLYDGQYARSYHTSTNTRDPTAIHVATCLGLYRTTVSLLNADTRCAIDDRDFNDESAVMVAVRKNHSRLVTLFVQRGAKVDLGTSTGREVLLYAAGHRLTRVTDKIIDRAQRTAIEQKSTRRSGFNHHPADKGVFLLCAAYDDDGMTVSHLLRDSKFVKTVTEDGVLGVCLLLAAQKLRHDIVRILLAKGADINSRDAAGRTALHRAAEWNDKALVEMLLERNADVNIRDEESMTAWSSISGSIQHAEVEAILRARTDANTAGEGGVSALYVAATGGHTAVVRRLLRTGADPNLATGCGWCPLHWAAGNGHYGCTKLLLESGADPSPLSDTGETPLDTAVMTKRDRIIALLLLHEAKYAKELVKPERATSDSPRSQSAHYEGNLAQKTNEDQYQDPEVGNTIFTRLHENPISLGSQPEPPIDIPPELLNTSSLEIRQPKKKRWWKKISMSLGRTSKASDTDKTPKLHICWPRRKRP